MILRIEQFLHTQWIHIIDIPIDDYGEQEIQELETTLAQQFLTPSVSLHNPEAGVSIILTPDNGPIRVQRLYADPATHLYTEQCWGD